jgi:hypothetical protein
MKMKEKRLEAQKLVVKTQMVEPLCVGICVNCIHKKYCTYPKTNQRMFCEEYEI